MRIAARAQLRHGDIARVAVHVEDADLDQFMCGQRALHLGRHAVGEAFAAQEHDGLERVCARLERPAFGRRQSNHC